MPLSFCDTSPILPNNKALAVRRLCKLRQRFAKDKKYREDYIAFMNDAIDKDYAEEVQDPDISSSDGHVWYIPHHGVYHPKKPEKICVVFDCSADYKWSHWCVVSLQRGTSCSNVQYRGNVPPVKGQREPSRLPAIPLVAKWQYYGQSH